MNASEQYEVLADKIVECMKIINGMEEHIPVDEREGLLKLFDYVQDRRAALMVQTRLKVIHVDRAQQPRRGILRWLGMLG